MDSRSKNGVRNVAAGFINRAVQMILPFITRTLIVYYLGEKFLGLGGLFTSILMVLNLSELGFGSALVFSMYKPIAEGDNNKVCALLNLYKRIYTWIGIIICICGVLFAPFIPYIIKGDLPEGVNIYIIYFIYLSNTVLSYLVFAHKKALLTAYQRSDILSNVNSVVFILSSIIQIALLVTTSNYYFYIIVLPIFTIVDNLWTNYITNKRYPEIVAIGDISKGEKQAIWKHVKGIALQKVCSTSRSTFSNIIISMFLGLVTIAKYGNYFYIMEAIHSFLYQIPNSIRATVGNSVTSETVEKNFNDFGAMYLVYMWISGWCATCLFCLFQPFMRLWMGEDLMFPISTVILICIYFVLLCLSDIIALYKDGAGLWWQGRYRVVIEAISNLILSFLFGWLWGVNGLLIAMIITLSILGHGYGGYIVFHYYFKGYSFLSFIVTQIGYLVIISIVSYITFLICTLIHGGNYFQLIIDSVICIICPNILYYAFFRFLPSWKDALLFVKNIIKTAKKK